MTITTKECECNLINMKIVMFTPLKYFGEINSKNYFKAEAFVPTYTIMYIAPTVYICENNLLITDLQNVF